MNEGKSNWPKDYFGWAEVTSQIGCLWLLPLMGVILALLSIFISTGVRSRSGIVVIYAAQDQVYAEPILRDFETQTGIKVRAIYDSEATKTVAIANRLLAERSHPQCDVYWGNEELRTRKLAA